MQGNMFVLDSPEAQVKGRVRDLAVPIANRAPNVVDSLETSPTGFLGSVPDSKNMLYIM